MVSAKTHISQKVATGELQPGSAGSEQNVGELERLLALGAGSLLVLDGITRRSPLGLALAALGGGLLYRAWSGYCPLYDTLGVSTSTAHSPAAGVAANQGVKVVRSVTINRPAAELYRMWHDFEGLPRFMSHLVSVHTKGDRSHWVARAPVGMSVAWDAEIVNDEPNRLIAWRSLEGSQVATAGSVHFTPAPGNRGTEVRVTLKYDPPAGRLGSWLAWLFGEEPGLQVRDDLYRFKQLAETGEVATVKDQASGRW